MSRRSQTGACAGHPAPAHRLAACGDDSGSDDGTEGAGLESLTVEGDVGTAPEVTFDGQVSVSEVETETLITGEGDEVEEGDQVLTHLWIGNGFSQREALDTYKDKKPELLTVDDSSARSSSTGHGGPDHRLPRPGRCARRGRLRRGRATPRSRSPTRTPSSSSSTSSAASSTDPRAPTRMLPTGRPRSSRRTACPPASTSRAPPSRPTGCASRRCVQGDGAEVEKGQTIVVDYLGQVYGGEEPFDASYSRGEPASFQIGTGNVIKGWDQALVGRAVGQPGDAVDPARARLRQGGQQGRRHQGNRHAGTSSSTSWPRAERSSRLG